MISRSSSARVAPRWLACLGVCLLAALIVAPPPAPSRAATIAVATGDVAP